MLANGLGSALSQAHTRTDVFDLMLLLADDPKWEVRKEIAELLPHLTESELAPLAARLTEDPNAYVRAAAQRGIDRRRRGQSHSRGSRFDVPDLSAEMELLESLHGQQVARRVRVLSDRRYELMAGAAVHEIRSILTPLKSAVCRLCQDAGRGDLNVAAASDLLGTAATRLNLLEHFVEAMRVYTESVPVERTTESVNEVLDEACRLARDGLLCSREAVNGIQLLMKGSRDATFAMARPYIVGALRNIITNAFNAILARSPDGMGQIEILINGDGVDELRIEVSDNGMGIPADDLRELLSFIPGRLGKNGMGFGLPIARRNVDAHGGDLVIESVDGQGTTVTIVLPAPR